jgi:hypothetical protein
MPKKSRGAACALSGVESEAVAATAVTAIAVKIAAIDACFALMLISSAEPSGGGEVAVVGGRAL